MIKRAAVTGYTRGLGKSFFTLLEKHGYQVKGYSYSNGYDLRDYSAVTKLLEEIKDFDLFINNAKPDYAQAQIVYRLAREWQGTVISIGSQAVKKFPSWNDTYLLEYLTQKIALTHAHEVLEPISCCRLIIEHPSHLGNDTDDYVKEVIKKYNL